MRALWLEKFETKRILGRNLLYNYGAFSRLILILDMYTTISGLAVRVPGYTKETYCASCEVRTEFMYVT
jgi:hypothetical protein